MAGLKKLKELATSFSILYVEDKEGLRLGVAKFLSKIFDDVYVAADGVEALSKFKKYTPSIVVTDIKMPNMNGIELLKKIRKTSKSSKLIILSAFDEKDMLFDAISIGVITYLKKPIDINELAKALFLALKELKKEQEQKFFEENLKQVFNHQNSMVAMSKNQKLILVNKIFLNFFGVESLEEFNKRYKDLGLLFLEHDGFLYNKEDLTWYEQIVESEKKAFNVLLKDQDGQNRHFILKYNDNSHKDGYEIFSFDDITELDVVDLFKDEKSEIDDKSPKVMYELLESIMRNDLPIQLHNYYKGLSITNNAKIVSISENSITVKTNFAQQKAIRIEKRTWITSDTLPRAIMCKDIVFSEQKIELKNIYFTTNSPVTRSSVRVAPEEEHKVTLYINGEEFHGDVIIKDISIKAFRLGLKAYPAGLKIDQKVRVVMQLYINSDKFTFDVDGVMIRKYEHEDIFDVVFEFDFKAGQKSELLKYITKRQMAIIREFKGLGVGHEE
jgi:DNA-binding NarL/FixJ family response regulator